MARYARIEDGDECERWLPLLSAIVDGEAAPEQLMEIRPHLRNCTACRATVRELHATSAPLAALFPVALAPAADASRATSSPPARRRAPSSSRPRRPRLRRPRGVDRGPRRQPRAVRIQ